MEQGRHEELLARGDSGAYASLIALQARRRALDDDRPPRLAGPQLSLQRSGLSLQRSGLALSASAVSDASEGALAKGAPGAEEAPVARPSYWRLLAMNKPEWKYGAAGALGAIGAGAVNPVFALLLISVRGAPPCHEYAERRHSALERHTWDCCPPSGPPCA